MLVGTLPYPTLLPFFAGVCHCFSQERQTFAPFYTSCKLLWQMPCFWDVLHGCHFPGIADIGQTQMFFCYNCQTFLKIKRGKRSAEIDKKYLLLLTTTNGWNWVSPIISVGCFAAKRKAICLLLRFWAGFSEARTKKSTSSCTAARLLQFLWRKLWYSSWRLGRCLS